MPEEKKKVKGFVLGKVPGDSQVYYGATLDSPEEREQSFEVLPDFMAPWTHTNTGRRNLCRVTQNGRTPEKKET